MRIIVVGASLLDVKGKELGACSGFLRIFEFSVLCRETSL